MKTIGCFGNILIICLLSVSVSKAEYDKAKLEETLGQFVAIKDAVEFLSTTECGEYIDFEYKKYNVLEEAKNHLTNQDYAEFLETLASEHYKVGREGIVRKINDGIAKKKSEGLSRDQICTDLIKKAGHSYENTLMQWDIVKKTFSDNNSLYNLDEIKLQAKQGNADAQYNLGVIYEQGIGISVDSKKAINWYQKAAEQGRFEAQYNLGLMYSRGVGGKQDYRKAKKWFGKAAESGDAQSQTLLGVLYAEGKGVAQNYEEAVKWYQKAADQGNPEAQALLGEMYLVGKGVTEDYKKAAALFRKAAQQGDADSQYYLGSMYAKGEGVVANGIMSYAYLSLAVSNGNSEAVEIRDLVAKHISEDEIEQSRKIAANIQKKIQESKQE